MCVTIVKAERDHITRQVSVQLASPAVQGARGALRLRGPTGTRLSILSTVLGLKSISKYPTFIGEHCCSDHHSAHAQRKHDKDYHRRGEPLDTPRRRGPTRKAPTFSCTFWSQTFEVTPLRTKFGPTSFPSIPTACDVTVRRLGIGSTFWWKGTAWPGLAGPVRAHRSTNGHQLITQTHTRFPISSHYQIAVIITSEKVNCTIVHLVSCPCNMIC